MAAGADTLGSAGAGSSTDLIGSVDWGDSFSGGDTAVETPETSTEELDDPGTLDTDPAIDAIEEPVVEDEPEADEDAAADQPPPADQPELPDGVREGVDGRGRKEMRLTPQRYETFHTAHKTLREFEAQAGEPLTQESFGVRNRAYMGQEKLYTDLLSGEPDSQAAVLNHFLDEAQRAVEEGEVGTDPTLSLGTTMYEALQQRSPDGFAHLRMRAATDLMNEMYTEAQRSGNKSLAVSASHIAKALGLPYKRGEEISQYLATPPANADPAANLRAENDRLNAQIRERDSKAATEQFRAWKADASKSVTSAVLTEGIMPSLSAEQKAWEKFPTQFETHVIAPLNKAVKATISSDRNFLDRIALLERSAQRATSEQKRADYKSQIQQAYVNRTRLAVQDLKPKIMREAAVLLKQGSDATHARHQAAQGQKGPRGPQAPAPRSIIPGQDVVNPGGTFNAAAEARRLAQLLG